MHRKPAPLRISHQANRRDCVLGTATMTSEEQIEVALPRWPPELVDWRAIRIAIKLAGHMVPLRPARWRMTEALAANGMAVSFKLQGFAPLQKITVCTLSSKASIAYAHTHAALRP